MIVFKSSVIFIILWVFLDTFLISQAKVYIVHRSRSLHTPSNPGNANKAKRSYENDLLLLQLFNLIQQQEKQFKKCARIFSSIYGSRGHKLKCLKNIKHKRMEKAKIESKLSSNQFKDLTRISEDYVDMADLRNSKFSTDYIDFGDLRTERTASKFKDKKLRSESHRKSSHHSKNHERKSKARAAYSSSSDDESMRFISLAENLKKHGEREPKRFQVIGNDNGYELSITGSMSKNSDSESSSEEITIPRDNKYKKGNAKYSRPLKNKKSKNIEPKYENIASSASESSLEDDKIKVNKILQKPTNQKPAPIFSASSSVEDNQPVT